MQELQSRFWHQAVLSTQQSLVAAAGVLVQLSDRPLLCSAAMTGSSGDVVVGSADHALYVADTITGCKRRTLYSKSTGHTE